MLTDVGASDAITFLFTKRVSFTISIYTLSG